MSQPHRLIDRSSLSQLFAQAREDPCTVSELEPLTFGTEGELMVEQFYHWVIRNSGVTRPRWLILSLSEIAWWMLDLYFGLDASGFQKSSGLPSCACTATRRVDRFTPHSQVP